MGAEEYRDQVADIPLFESLSAALRERLCDILVNISEVTELSAGDILYEKDAEDDNTGAVLIKGALTVAGGVGTEFEVEPPNVVGEMQQFNEYGQRTATVSARSDSIVLQFSWHDFVKATAERPDISTEDRVAVHDTLAHLAGDRLKELSE